MMTLHELVERQARDNPKAPVLVLRQEVTTYSELDKKVTRLAAVLSARGVKAGDSFGLVMRNSVEFVVTFFAVVRLGARIVPVNFLLKADEISYIFEDAGVVGVLTQPPFLGNILEAKKKLAGLRDVFVTGGAREGALSFDELMAASQESPESVPRATNPDAVALIIYTSGTTGKPKGAMLTHQNFIRNAEQCRAMVTTLRRKDSFLCLLPMFHSFAWTVCVLLPIYMGCKIVIIESLQPFSDVIKQIVKQRVAVFVGVPPIYAALLRVPFWYPMRWINPLRICISGAAALPTAVHQKFEAKFGLPLMEGYGLTEASPVVTLNPESKRVAGSIGKALPGVELRFVDESGHDVADGEVGEICIKGDNVMKGYFHQDDATREAFLDDAQEWLRSGDLGFKDAEDYIHISDRKKDLIIVKGLNVYPKEVEDILMEHPAVLEAAVVGIADETGDELIRAYVTLKPDAQVDKQELLKLCRGKLAPYKCPKDLEIRKDLPKNTLGKILKRELRKS